MATSYYISTAANGGSNSNNGLGPDASHATNKPWLTLEKALHAGTPVVAGDTIWVSSGTYYATASVPIAGIATTANPTAIRGDPTNSQGFKNASGVRLPVGMRPWFTVRTAVEGMDSDVASANSVINGTTNGTNGFQFYDLVLEAGMQNNICVNINFNNNADWLFDGCFLIGTSCIRMGAGAPTAGRNLIVRRCELWGQMFGTTGTTAAATADADLNVLFESNFVIGRMSSTNIQIGAVAGNLGGGVNYRFNRIFVGGIGTSNLSTVAGGVSTVKPIRLEGNTLMGGGVPVNAATAGQVVSDGNNRFMCGNLSTNFTLAGTDKINGAPQFMWPALFRLRLALPSEDVMGWAPDAPATVLHTSSTNTNPDFRNRTPRPWEAGPTIGPFEVGNIAQDVGSAITGGGVNSAKITGAGEFSLFVPVDAVATTFTVLTKSSGYGGTAWPQVISEAVPAAGLTQQTATATSAAEQTLTISVTPSVPTVLELRFLSDSSNGTSTTFFDVLARAV